MHLHCKYFRVNGLVSYITEYYTCIKWYFFIIQIYEKFAYSNPLHPDIFPDVTKMEAEVIQMCASLFSGDQQACGTVSTQLKLADRNKPLKITCNRVILILC